jgi:hypothetical protein
MTAIVEATALIPILDSGGNSIDFSSLITTVVPLTSDNSCIYAMNDRLNASGASTGQIHSLTFFVLAANSATALTAWTNFKAGLAVGTVVYLTTTTNVVQ